MGGTEDRIKGKANEAMGSAKQAVGKATDNEEMEADGTVQEAKGKAQGMVGKVKTRSRTRRTSASSGPRKQISRSTRSWPEQSRRAFRGGTATSDHGSCGCGSRRASASQILRARGIARVAERRGGSLLRRRSAVPRPCCS